MDFERTLMLRTSALEEKPSCSTQAERRIIPPWAALHENGHVDTGKGKNNLAIYKRPFSWRRSGPFPSLPFCFYKSVQELFFPTQV